MHANCHSTLGHNRQLTARRLRAVPAVLLLTTLITAYVAPLGRKRGCTAILMRTSSLAQPPIADRRQHNTIAEFDDMDNNLDPYCWLRDDTRQDSKVLDYLQQENNYAEQYFKQLDPTIDSLVHEMDSRVPDTEISQPELFNGHIYYRKRGPGDDYWTQYRWPLSQSTTEQQSNSTNAATPNLAEAVAAAVTDVTAYPKRSFNSLQQVVLDETVLSAGHKYWDIYCAVVSPDGARIAVPYDIVGDECYQIQVYDISSGQTLLDPPISGCTGELVWWGNSSDVLVYITQAKALKTDSSFSVQVLKLSQQQQQQQPASAVLYAPVQGESGFSLKASHDKQYIILESRLEGGTNVQALHTSQPLTFGSSSSSSNGALAVPASAWVNLITPDDDLDLLQVDHIGNIGQAANSSSSSSSGEAASISSSSSCAGIFLAIVDSDDAPDGELVLIHASGTNKDRPLLETLVPNQMNSRRPSSNAAAIAPYVSSSSNTPGQQQQQQQEQQVQRHLEINKFAVHSVSGYLAVAVRRSGVCAIDVYKLNKPEHPAAAAAAAPEQHTAGIVPVVTLQTSATSHGSSSSSSSSSAAAGQPRSAAAGSNSSGSSIAAELSWTLVADDSTLVMHLDSIQGSAEEPWLELHVSGITTPTAAYYVHLVTRKQVKVYEEAVIGFKPSQYTSNLEWAVSHDGTAVPVTLAYKTSLMHKDGTNKALLQGYGAYGSKQWPTFNPADLSLLDRGFVLAVAHVRGGGELGSAWHVDGKKFHKKSTFQVILAVADCLMQQQYTQPDVLAVRGRSADDLTAAAVLNLVQQQHLPAALQSFLEGLPYQCMPALQYRDFLAVARHLVQQQYTQPDLLAVWGRSAGGLTVAAALNLGPSFARVAILDVPFLDVLNTMRDPELPLTIKERSEWGDPLNSKDAYDYIKSYSPYSNIMPNATYPALLLTASLHDNRVNYWEPAKYVAAMRYYQNQRKQQQQQQGTASNSEQERPVLLLTDMNAGHFAASAASSRLRERAMKVAFILQNLGCR